MSNLTKMSWTSVYLTSLQLEVFYKVTGSEAATRSILHPVYDGSNGLKWKIFSERVNLENKDLNEVECPETIVKKCQEPMDLDLVINEIQNKQFL